MQGKSSLSSSSPPLSPSSIVDNPCRGEVAKARWAILRNALLFQSTQRQQRQHSIHRFSGYNLLEARQVESDSKFPEYGSSNVQIRSLLTEFRWEDKKNPSKNIDQLEIAILALSSCFPEGKCMRIVSTIKAGNGSSPFSASCIEAIKNRCQPCVCVWKVCEGLENDGEFEDDVSTVTMITTLLVRESSSSPKYRTVSYTFDSKKYGLNENSTRERNGENGGNLSIINTTHPIHFHTVWTREPREARLSLDDLISHRKNNGVDNTGNICVWDSERTLSYLLYHHIGDFFTLKPFGSHNRMSTIHADIFKDEKMQSHAGDRNGSKIHILELGSGMAGLSAMALGFRLAIHQNFEGGKLIVDDRNENKVSKRYKRIQIMLTDGNPSGVKNNAVNQYLTKLNSEMRWKKTGKYSPYLDLDIHCETLLWTTDLDVEKNSINDQDIVLGSDCVHFQNFHAALAITALRHLRVRASAIFCQPSRGQSLKNFYNLLITATLDKETSGSDSLLTCRWISHPIIDEKHHEASLKYKNVYDKDLHKPKILVVTKLRELTKKDQICFMSYQNRYSPITEKIFW